jgi:hypothetical protein
MRHTCVDAVKHRHMYSVREDSGTQYDVGAGNRLLIFVNFKLQCQDCRFQV